MGNRHRFNGIGNQLSAGQRIFHAGVVHSDPIADSDRIKNNGGAPGGINSGFDRIYELIQMHVPRYDFIKRIGYANDRPFQFPVGKTVCS